MADDDAPVQHCRLDTGVDIPNALESAGIEYLDVETRQMGDRAECDLCDEMIDFDRAIPNGAGEPCNRRCWAEVYDAPEWFPDTCSVNRTEREYTAATNPFPRPLGFRSGKWVSRTR
jgi:hypothetical protein